MDGFIDFWLLTPNTVWISWEQSLNMYVFESQVTIVPGIQCTLHSFCLFLWDWGLNFGLHTCQQVPYHKCLFNQCILYAHLPKDQQISFELETKILYGVLFSIWILRCSNRSTHIYLKVHFSSIIDAMSYTENMTIANISCIYSRCL